MDMSKMDTEMSLEEVLIQMRIPAKAPAAQVLVRAELEMEMRRLATRKAKIEKKMGKMARKAHQLDVAMGYIEVEEYMDAEESARRDEEINKAIQEEDIQKRTQAAVDAAVAEAEETARAQVTAERELLEEIAAQEPAQKKQKKQKKAAK